MINNSRLMKMMSKKRILQVLIWLRIWPNCDFLTSLQFFTHFDNVMETSLHIHLPVQLSYQLIQWHLLPYTPIKLSRYHTTFLMTKITKTLDKISMTFLEFHISKIHSFSRCLKNAKLRTCHHTSTALHKRHIGQCFILDEINPSHLLADLVLERQPMFGISLIIMQP